MISKWHFHSNTVNGRLRPLLFDWVSAVYVGYYWYDYVLTMLVYDYELNVNDMHVYPLDETYL